MSPAAMSQADVHGAIIGLCVVLVGIGLAIVVLLVENRRQKRRAGTAARRRYAEFVALPTPQAPKPPLVYPTEILPPVGDTPPAAPGGQPTWNAATQLIARVTDEPDATAFLPRIGGTR